MSTWNFGDVWEAVADELPDAPALTHGTTTLTWGELDRRADNLARWLLGAGVGHQDKVAIYLYNCSEYLETTFACFKLGLVPINTNYRYADDELVYLWENADTVAVVFHGVFAERIEGIRDRLPSIRPGCGSTTGRRPVPTWAVPYEEAAGTTGRTGGRSGSAPPWGRGPDDLYLLYTGGHHRHAQGRHVAPGRPLRPPQQRRVPALSRGRGRRTTSEPSSGAAARG